MAFQYSLEDQTFLTTAFQWRHTIWPHVLGNLGFWLLLVLHLFFWCAFRYDFLDKHLAKFDMELAEGVLRVHGEGINIITGILTFFAVFFTQQCYNRYLALHYEVNQVFRSIHRFGFTFKQTFCSIDARGDYSSGKECFWLAMRWVHAHTVLFFTEIQHGSVLEEDWDHVLSIGLLHADEIKNLRSYTCAQCSFVLLDWVTRVSVEGHARSNLPNKGHHAKLMNLIGLVDEAKKRVLDIVRMPVHYQYFHMMNIIVMMNASVWSYAMAMDESIFGPISFFFASFIFIGMLELAKMFSDPFGDDEGVDFPIHQWCEKFLENQLGYLQERDGVSNAFFANKLKFQCRNYWQPGQIEGTIGTRRESIKLRQSQWAEDVQEIQSKLFQFPAIGFAYRTGFAYRPLPSSPGTPGDFEPVCASR